MASALTGIASWESDGGPPPGCSKTIVWEFAANPRQPPPPPGEFTITTAYPWTGPFSNSCMSTNPQYVCRASLNNPAQGSWEIKPN